MASHDDHDHSDTDGSLETTSHNQLGHKAKDHGRGLMYKGKNMGGDNCPNCNDEADQEPKTGGCGHGHNDTHDDKHTCGDHRHDHKHGSTCSHGHHHDHAHEEHSCGHDHDHEEDIPSKFNGGLLKTAFGGTGESDKADQALNNVRSLALLGAAASLYSVNTSDSVAWAATVGVLSLIVANDAAEELMESIQYVQKKLRITGAAVGMTLSAAHVSAEGFLAIRAQISEKFNQLAGSDQASQLADVAMQVSMSNNFTHSALMLSSVALAGALAVDERRFWKANLGAMLVTSATLAGHVISGGDNPWLSTGLGATGLGVAGLYGWWRIRAGIGCSRHGDLCGKSHAGPKDETDYLSRNYLGGLAKRIKETKRDEAFGKLKQTVQRVKEKISNAKMPTRKQVFTIMKGMLPLALPFGALGLGAHAAGDSVVLIAKQSQLLSPTALGLIASTAWVAPELIASVKSVVRKNSELAAAMIIGCTVFGTGGVGGIQSALSSWFGNGIPETLSLENFNGWVQMGALALPVAAYAAVANTSLAKHFARADNKVSEFLESTNLIKKAGRVSNWLRQSTENIQAGKVKVSKTASAFMLAASIGYFAINSQPNCHWHGDVPHCIDMSADVEIPLTYE